MSTLPEDEFTIHLPRADGVVLDQDEEYCEIEVDGRRRRIRFHDYGEIFDTPGLYERLFADSLSCESPRVVVDLLEDVVTSDGEDPQGLDVLDFGAGNGMVGEQLARIGAQSIVGVDLLEQAKHAAERDRPGIYEEYHALDMTALPAADRQALERRSFNCLTCVAALGFGDVPPEAFKAAYDVISAPGWIAFNIRDQFVDDDDVSGFSQALDGLFAEGALVERARVTYPHRLSARGEPLNYVAIVAQKQVPELQAA
jgi:SAM-dependent methyltransferase